MTRFPDAEAVAVKGLEAAIVATGRIYSEIPNDPTFPLITLQRVGGLTAVRLRLDRAAIQVNAWAETKEAARDAAADAHAALHAIEGMTVEYGEDDESAFVTAVNDEVGLTWVPDPLTHRPRYLFRVALYLHTA